MTDPSDDLQALVADLAFRVAAIQKLLAERGRAAPAPAVDRSWRSRLWLVPADTMLSCREAAEALGKTRAAIHKLAARRRLPFTRSSHARSPVAGAPLMFRAADLRRFLEGHQAA